VNKELLEDAILIYRMNVDIGFFYAPYIPKMKKPKYNFSRTKWFEADREMVKTKSAYVKFSTEQFSWCVAQFGPQPNYPDAWSRWYMINDRFRFRDEKDYIWFLLRWS
jgi:hypothetical protein